jgi:hypothetical protein
MAGGANQSSTLQIFTPSLLYSFFYKLSVSSFCDFPGFAKIAKNIFDGLLG